VRSTTIASRLRLWHDLNHNGISEPDELIPASQILTTIGLGYTPSRRHDRFGNLFKYCGFAWYVDGYQRAIYDVPMLSSWLGSFSCASSRARHPQPDCG
jgi:hypothetical protein